MFGLKTQGNLNSGRMKSTLVPKVTNMSKLKMVVVITNVLMSVSIEHVLQGKQELVLEYSPVHGNFACTRMKQMLLDT